MCLFALQGIHEDVRAVAFDHATGALVLAGAGGARSRCPGVTLSLWEYSNGQLAMRKAHGSSKSQVCGVRSVCTYIRVCMRECVCVCVCSIGC